MKYSKIVIMVSALSMALMYGISNSSAQTGSRIGVSTQPRTTIWMGSPGEITQIRSLLQAGKAKEAIEVARTFLALVERDRSEGSVLFRYPALNALCVALSTDGQLVEAMSVCEKAVALFPDRWRAINSRGTIHYLAGRYEGAIADYRQGLQLEPDSGDITAILQHNLDLAEGRLSGS